MSLEPNEKGSLLPGTNLALRVFQKLVDFVTFKMLCVIFAPRGVDSADKNQVGYNSDSNDTNDVLKVLFLP